MEYLKVLKLRRQTKLLKIKNSFLLAKDLSKYKRYIQTSYLNPLYGVEMFGTNSKTNRSRFDHFLVQITLKLSELCTTLSTTSTETSAATSTVGQFETRDCSCNSSTLTTIWKSRATYKQISTLAIFSNFQIHQLGVSMNELLSNDQRHHTISLLM